MALTHDFCYRVGGGCLKYTATRQPNGCRVVEEMARQLSMATRRELKNAIRQRSQESRKRRERRQILAEFVRVTGYHRKHAQRVANHSPTAFSGRQRERVYDEAVHQALVVLWEAADRICGKRPRVLLPGPQAGQRPRQTASAVTAPRQTRPA